MKSLLRKLAVSALACAGLFAQNSAVLPTPKVQFLGSNGQPLAGGKVFTYAAGTTTPLATYTDSTLGVANANPVILDTAGMANIWLSAAAYKIVVQNSAGVQQWTVDNLTDVGQILKRDLADSTNIANGDALIAMKQPGAGSVARTVHDKLAEYVTAKDFGAKFDGATDDTTAIQAAINALGSGGSLQLSNGTACISATLTLPAVSNIRIYGESPAATLSNCSNTAVSGAMISGDYSAGAQQSGIVIENLTLIGGTSLTNDFKRGVYLRNATKSAVRNLKISGVDSPAAGPGDARAIWFDDSVTFSEASGNMITFATGAVNDAAFRIGVLFTSLMSDANNGVAAGVTGLAQTNTDNVIANNRIYGGTHGIDLQNTARVTIKGNTCSTQGQRNLIIFATNKDIAVSGNVFFSAGSVNLIADFGNQNLSITGNTFDTTTGGEGANVELYYDNQNVTVSGNSLLNTNSSGVFIGYKASRIAVTGNVCYSATANVNCIYVSAAMGPNYTAVLPTPAIDKVTIRGNLLNVTGAAGANGIVVRSKETGSVLDPVPLTNVLVDGNFTFNGCYGVIFSKNAGTGTFTPTMGDHNVMVGSACVDGPFGSDYNVARNDTGTAPPTNGNWDVGSFRRNSVPSSGAPFGWVNVAAGSPGTWVQAGIVDNTVSKASATLSLVDPAATAAYGVDASGPFIKSVTAAKTTRVYDQSNQIASFNATNTLFLFNQTAVSGKTNFAVRAGAGNVAGDLLAQVQDGTATNMWWIRGDGGVGMNSTGTQPACDGTVRGIVWFGKNAGAGKDNFQICAQDAGGLSAWRVLY